MNAVFEQLARLLDEGVGVVLVPRRDNLDHRDDPVAADVTYRDRAFLAAMELGRRVGVVVSQGESTVERATDLEYSLVMEGVLNRLNDSSPIVRRYGGILRTLLACLRRANGRNIFKDETSHVTISVYPAFTKARPRLRDG